MATLRYTMLVLGSAIPLNTNTRIFQYIAEFFITKLTMLLSYFLWFQRATQLIGKQQLVIYMEPFAG